MKKFAKALLVFFLVVLMATLLFLLFLPTFLSSNYARSRLITGINRNIPGKVNFESLELSWLGNQTIKNLNVDSSDGHSVLSMGNANIGLSLPRLLVGNNPIIPIKITDLRAEFITDAEGKSTIEKALGVQTKSGFILPEPMTLDRVNVDVLLSNQREKIKAEANGFASFKGQEEPFHLNALFDEFKGLSLQAEKFPIVLLDQLLSVSKPKYANLLLTILGSTADINVNQDQQGAFTANLASSQIHGQFKGSVNNQFIAIEEGAVNFNLPKENIVQLAKGLHCPITPLQPVQGTLKIDSLKMPKGGEDWQNLEATLHLQVSPFSLDSQNKHALVINQLKGVVVVPEEGPVTLKIDLSGLQGQTQLNLNISAKADKAPPDQMVHSAVQLEGQFAHLPLKWACLAFSIEPLTIARAQAFFGEFIDGSVTAQIKEKKGPIDLLIKGDNGHFILKGDLRQNVLVLREPLKAEAKISKNLENLILKPLNPMLTSIVNSDGPITFIIPVESFYLPIDPVDLKKASIQQASLTLPKLTFSRVSELGKILAFLGLTESTFDLLSTPLFFSLNEGQLTLDRMDLLVNNRLPLALWGQINFNKDSLNLVLGISGAALENAFAIQGINKGSFFQVPIKGSINKPQIDTTKLTARISALIAQVHGKQLFGNLLEAASGSYEDKVPSPTTDPLPWADKLIESEKTDSLEGDEKQKAEKKDGQSFKELKKEASSLIKDLFRN